MGGVIIKNEKDRDIEFTFDEINEIIDSLNKKFEYNWFPLSNNVVKVQNHTAEEGLGKTIYNLTNNINKAQGASYLGPFLEEIGLMKFSKNRTTVSNNKKNGWNLNSEKVGIDIQQLIEEYENY